MGLRQLIDVNWIGGRDDGPGESHDWIRENANTIRSAHNTNTGRTGASSKPADFDAVSVDEVIAWDGDSIVASGAGGVRAAHESHCHRRAGCIQCERPAQVRGRSPRPHVLNSRNWLSINTLQRVDTGISRTWRRILPIRRWCGSVTAGGEYQERDDT